MLASLFVASTWIGEAPGRSTNSAGSCTRPPPPEMASIQPANPAARQSSRTSLSSGTASAPGGGATGVPAVDDPEQVTEPLHHGVRVALDVSALVMRDVAVRHEDGTHADLLRAVHVVVGAVADEHDALWLGDPDSGHRRAKR